jgi:chromosome segregation ATPase
LARERRAQQTRQFQPRQEIMDQAAIQQMINAAVQAAQQQLQQELAAARNDLANAQNQINALQANAPINVPPPVVQAVPPEEFGYTPGTIGAAGALINYKTSEGAKIQRAAIAKLVVEHDLDKEHLYDFLEAI